jgi:hypothetical protein
MVALMVRCLGCEHVWCALHLPMELAKAARVLRTIHCPKCAAGPNRVVCVDETRVTNG